MVPSTGYIKVFDLIPLYDGLLLRYPVDYEKMEMGELEMQPKLFDIFREHKAWVKLLKISTVASLNSLVENKRAGDLIKVGEALHEKKIAQIADQIKQKGNVKECVLCKSRWTITSWIASILRATRKAITILRRWKPLITSSLIKTSSI